MSDFYLSLRKQKRLAGLYIDAEDYLSLLVELLPRSAYIAEAEVWVDGFYGYQPGICGAGGPPGRCAG